MTDLIRGVILGVIEGLTEFLPVSSTGHLILAMPLLGIEEHVPPWNSFLFLVQVGAILAVVLYFWRPLWQAALAAPTRGWSNHLVAKLLIAFIPAAVVGLLLDDWMERHLEKPLPIALALILGAAVMEWIERGHRQGATASIEDVTWKQALGVGLAQCVSIVPGTSRSMATIMGGLLVGMRPDTAAVFSFYLAIPTICAAGAYRLLKHYRDLRSEDAMVLGAGFATAFIVALLVVDGFMRFVRRRRLRAFAIYRVILGAAILAALYGGWPRLG